MKSQKGSAFEREVCKMLSLWWTEGNEDDVFWRTSQSGGRATTRGKQGKKTANSHGDIGATDDRGLPFLKAFTVEIKRGYNLSHLSELMDTPPDRKCLYADWISRLERDRIAANAKSWMLIHRRDRRKCIIYIPGWANKRLMGLGAGLSYRQRISLVTNFVEVWGYYADEFLASVTPDHVKRILEC